MGLCFIVCHATALTILVAFAAITAFKIVNPMLLLLVAPAVGALTAPLLYQATGPLAPTASRRRPALLDPLLRRLRQHGTSPDALADVAKEVAASLGVGYIVVEFHDGAGTPLLRSRWGEPPGTGPVRLPLTYDGEVDGALLLAMDDVDRLRRAGDALDEMLASLAVTAHLYRTSDALWRAKLAVDSERERLDSVREQERWRLRRDLHDGLGPVLAAVMMQIDAVRSLATKGSSKVTPHLTQLSRDARVAVDDVRQMVRDLSPRGLDGLGLLPAVRLCAARFERASGGRLRVRVEAPDRLPPLPSQVELAMYRIVGEALTNVARHSHAHSCVLRFEAADCLRLDIVDDGIGLPNDHAAGLGLSSIRDRVQELHGDCAIESLSRGTWLWVRLPLVRDGEPVSLPELPRSQA